MSFQEEKNSQKKSYKIISSPNIALIKYWGKKEFTKNDPDSNRNLPLNPSLSLTLSKAQTEILIEESAEREFEIQGQKVSPKDFDKLSLHVERIEKALDCQLPPFKLHSSNNFPTGTGIASSASAFSALTCAFLSWAKGNAFCQEKIKNDPQWIADLARRGSGSACRSLHGPFVKWWDKEIHIIESNWKLYDTILIFSSKEKTVSSSEGHLFATQSPLFAKRLEKIPTRMKIIEKSIQSKDLALMGPVIEEEADDMHQIMRNNPHPVEYQLPSTKVFLEALKKLKSRNFFYTLDAGPNVHLLSEQPIAQEMKRLLKDLQLEAQIWEDCVGYGPQITSL